MSNKAHPDTSKSDDEQFEDAQSKDDFNQRSVDEIIQKVTGLATKPSQEPDAEEFVDCLNDVSASEVTKPPLSDPGTDEELADNPQTTSAPYADDVIDEDSQRDFESGLSDEEKEANRTKADELKQQGNERFKLGEHCQAVELYTNALRLCPLDCKENRAILYANRAAAKTKLDIKSSALEDCSKALEYNPVYVKALMRRATLYEETDKLDESLEDFRKVLELEPTNVEARLAVTRLPPKIETRNEHLKEEMMGKLKDLGNMILRPFGLSTQNFEMKQDPSTGSYSINFNQNSKQ